MRSLPLSPRGFLFNSIFIIMLSTSSSRVVSHSSREFTPGDVMCTVPDPMPCVLTLETLTIRFDQPLGTYWTHSSTPCGRAEGDHTPQQGQCQGGVWAGGILFRCLQIRPADSNGVSLRCLCRHYMPVFVRGYEALCDPGTSTASVQHLSYSICHPTQAAQQQHLAASDAILGDPVAYSF